MVNEPISDDLYNEDDARCPHCFEWVCKDLDDHLPLEPEPEYEEPVDV